MCGRYTLKSNGREVAERFSLRPERMPPLKARYNIAPSQDVPVVRVAADGERELVMLHWGLLPFWAKEAKISYSTINARAETVATKPAFRAAFKKRRCLIPADGFYEWQTVAGRKQPFRIHMKDDGVFAMAGIWEHWEGESDGTHRVIESCSIIVTDGNDVLKPIHDRMPVILDPKHFDLWLDARADAASALQPLLTPYPADEMDAYPVSTVVNNARNDEVKCVEPAS